MNDKYDEWIDAWNAGFTSYRYSGWALSITTWNVEWRKVNVRGIYEFYVYLIVGKGMDE